MKTHYATLTILLAAGLLLSASLVFAREEPSLSLAAVAVKRASQTPTPMNTPTATPTVMATPTEQKRYAVSVKVSVPVTQVLKRQSVPVSTDIEIESVGCGGGVMDVTLNSSSDLFVPLSPTRVPPSDGTFVLQAQAPGTAELCVTSFGEYSCGNGAWYWHYATGCSPQITILTDTVKELFIPLVNN